MLLKRNVFTDEEKKAVIIEEIQQILLDMSACGNHALWIENLKKQENIYRKHRSGTRKPDILRQVVTDPKHMRKPESSFKEMHHYPHTDCMPPEQRKANRCANCNSIPTVFCYTCCQCGCRPSIPMDVNLGMPAFREINQMGCCKQCQCSTCPADRERSSCKKCNCSNCPTDADPYCKCKCRSKQSPQQNWMSRKKQCPCCRSCSCSYRM
ncbi:hypothetical protein AVEN_258510-1 [Araneus ventricosus]|uniref:Uncharacterized protein n=1 Tax=Araneus ventricosus TaxID=182803 RepID=A0A4Y2GYI1_ARAVE|nr:hypothetical protein AVEN_258510-1 [Araneus ventricosus]